MSNQESINLKIGIIVAVIFLTSFSIIYVVGDWYNSNYSINVIVKNWFDERFDSKEDNIYIVGASYVWPINASHVQQIISKAGHEYEVYNLGVQAERFNPKLKYIDKLILSNPNVVVLGLPYPGTIGAPLGILATTGSPAAITTINNEESDLTTLTSLDFEEYLDIETYVDLDNFKNPKFVSLNLVDILSDKKPQYNLATKEPFIPNHLLSTIRNDEMIKKHLLERSPGWLKKSPSYENVELNAFKEIVKKLKEKKIKVIVFVPPFHEFYWEEIGDEKEAKFISIIETLESDLDIKIYNLHDSYSDKKIWADGVHISRHPQSIIYSNDVAKIIIGELNS